MREDVGNGGCGGYKVHTQTPVVWKFWQEDERVAKFLKEGIKTTFFLAKWMTLAFLLESMMLTWLQAHLAAPALHLSGLLPLVGVLQPISTDTNGYAALPLVGGLMEQGMAPGAGIAFLVAGGVSS